jgi:RNA polymerase sigma-70 factor, ECF subfamily
VSLSQSIPSHWFNRGNTGEPLQSPAIATARRYPQGTPLGTPQDAPLDTDGQDYNNEQQLQDASTMNSQVKKIWKEAFKGFYKKHSRPLWFYIFKTCRDQSLADDVFQDAFYRFLRAEPIKMNEYQQKAYLYKIATNLIIDHLRKVKRTVEREIEKDPRQDKGFEECQQEQVFLGMDMDNLFKLLKPKERTMLWLAYVEGYSHKEIAQITGINETSIKVKMFRARKKFAGILTEKGYDSQNKSHQPKSNEGRTHHES